MKKILKRVYRFSFYLLGKLPVKKNTIIFESFLGKQYSDNPRAIYEYMVEHNYNYKMYWSFEKKTYDSFKNRNINSIKRFSIKWLFLMPRAEYWVSNSRLPLWIPKPHSTKYIQTWHGTPLKKLAADMDKVYMPGTDTEKYKRNFLTEARKWDYLISPNEYSTQIFKRAFQFKNTLIESGYPRNDYLFTSNNEKTLFNIKKSLDLPLNKKIILYAPTWRDNLYYSRGKYKFTIQMDLEQMKNSLGKKYIILLRLHYLVTEDLDLTSYSDFVYDFSNYEDIRDLYLISDFLITDYSSVFFDFAILKRPIIFYVYDLEDYRDNLRGFYFDFELNAPGPLVRKTEEIIEIIKKNERGDFYKNNRSINDFSKSFCSLEDGMASKRVVENIFKK